MPPAGHRRWRMARRPARAALVGQRAPVSATSRCMTRPRRLARDRERAALGHRGRGVHRQRHHHLLQRVGVDPDARAAPWARWPAAGRGRGRVALEQAQRERQRLADVGGWSPCALGRTSRAGTARSARSERPRSRIRSRNWRASRRASRLPLAASEASASAQPAMPASGFEISWATPETSWPRNARRSYAISRISSCALRGDVLEPARARGVTGCRAAPAGGARGRARPGLDDLLVRAARCSTRRSTGSVARSLPCRARRAAACRRRAPGGARCGPCSRTRFQATTWRLRSTM